jgi:hypothetical protein
MTETMTYDEALARIPQRTIPDFWVGDPDALARLLETVRRGAVRALATTPGGRAVHLVAYGDPERVPRQANFNSAIGARQPAAYADRERREKPVLYFAGPVHGHETEGLTGLANLIRVMETGEDLAGAPRPRLRQLGEACRLLIVPTGNPDGLARFRPRLLHGMGLDDIRFWGQGTWADDTLCGWPGCKSRHPMQGRHVGWLGCYFNDDGINPMHDEFFAPMSAEVTALLDLARAEAPEVTVVLHSHEAPPALLRPAYVPLAQQQEVGAIALRTYAHLEAQGLAHGASFKPQAESGSPPAAFNLISAVYHVSGATSFTFECPHGTRGERAASVSPAEILEIQLTLYRAVMTHALASKGCRPTA